MSASIVEAAPSFVPRPRQRHVQCVSPSGLASHGLYRMGRSGEPARAACACTGLTRSGRDFDEVAKVFAASIGWCVRTWSGGACRLAGRSPTLRQCRSSVRHGHAHRAAERGNGGLVRDVDGRTDRARACRNAETPIRKMLLNDVGPHIEPVARQRIGDLSRQAGEISKRCSRASITPRCSRNLLAR